MSQAAEPKEPVMLFLDRRDGGRRLAARLRALAGQPDLVIVGLPRGGVPVAAEVAAGLGAPLDVIVVRKLGVPFRPELAMGAVGEDGVRVLNDEVIRTIDVTPEDIADIERRERTELQRRAERFRRGRARLSLADKHVVVVDDGIATGATARAACRVARAEGARRVTLAVPVAPADWTRRLAGVADDLIAVDTPSRFGAVGQFYGDFDPTSDDEVVRLLDEAAARVVGTDEARPAVGGAARDEDVVIRVGSVALDGHLRVPHDACGLVIFAHGSGSSRHSPRNRFVAEVLGHTGLATLLLDLLTPTEEQLRSNVFDIELLADRVAGAARWTAEQTDVRELPIGLFGASTGAGAALWAAADADSAISAVVSRGGRPDLAGERLADVRAPTLLIVGGDDTVVLGLNRLALDALGDGSELVVIPGATHLFEEPGTLAAAAEAARDWFVDHLARQATPG